MAVWSNSASIALAGGAGLPERVGLGEGLANLLDHLVVAERVEAAAVAQPLAQDFVELVGAGVLLLAGADAEVADDLVMAQRGGEVTRASRRRSSCSMTSTSWRRSRAGGGQCASEVEVRAAGAVVADAQRGQVAVVVEDELAHDLVPGAPGDQLFQAGAAARRRTPELAV